MTATRKQWLVKTSTIAPTVMYATDAQTLYERLVDRWNLPMRTYRAFDGPESTKLRQYKTYFEWFEQTDVEISLYKREKK